MSHTQLTAQGGSVHERPTTEGASATREGVRAGVLGATAVALWFLVADLCSGTPFLTPLALGGALASAAGVSPFALAPAVVIAAYTVVHYLAFAAFGVLAARVAHRARQEPTVLAAALLVFAVAEVAFHGTIALLHETTFVGPQIAMQVGIANMIGSALVGAVLWRDHPELNSEIAHALGNA